MSAFSGFCHFVLRSICLLGWLAKHKTRSGFLNSLQEEKCLACERDAQQKIKTQFQGISWLTWFNHLVGRLGCERKQNLCVLIPEHLKQCATGEGTKSFQRIYQKFLPNLHRIVHIFFVILQFDCFYCQVDPKNQKCSLLQAEDKLNEFAHILKSSKLVIFYSHCRFLFLNNIL